MRAFEFIMFMCNRSYSFIWGRTRVLTLFVASICPFYGSENTPWLLPLYEPEVTVGFAEPLRSTKSFGSSPLGLVRGQGTFSEGNEVGFLAYTRPSSLSLSYEKRLSNDLEHDHFASSLFAQAGNALPWNMGMKKNEYLSLLGGVRLGSHYYVSGARYGQIFTSLGFVGERKTKLQDLFHLGVNFAFSSMHKVQMEVWDVFGVTKSQTKALMISYTYTRETGSHWTLGYTLQKNAHQSMAPFVILSYSLPIIP